MIFNLAAKKLISHDAETTSVNLRGNFAVFVKGLISFPLDIPGTAYHECLQVTNNYAHVPNIYSLQYMTFELMCSTFRITTNLSVLSKFRGPGGDPYIRSLKPAGTRAIAQHLCTKPSNNWNQEFPLTKKHCLWPQGRKRAMALLKNMLQERRKMPRKENKDFFDYVLEELSKQGTMLTEGIALDLMFALLFASFETTSLALTLAMKYLTDYPLVLQTLTVCVLLVVNPSISVLSLKCSLLKAFGLKNFHVTRKSMMQF